MNKSRMLLSATLAIVGFAGSPVWAAEFPADHTIVVSDDWCAPNNDGACNKCNLGHLVRGARCSGSYCDNMIYSCTAPPIIKGEQILMSNGTFYTGYTQAADGEWSGKALCPNGTAMVGMDAFGNYSSNIRTICQAVYRSSWSGITLYQNRYNPISDDYPLNTTVYADYWLAGASCTGDFCDNMYYWYQGIM